MFKYFKILVIACFWEISLLPGSQACAATFMLSWNSVRQDTSGAPVCGPVYYYVYRDTIPSFQPGTANFFVATPDTFIQDNDSRLADPHTNLYYAVKALDAYGNESAYSTKAGEKPFVLLRTRVLLQSVYESAVDTMACSLKNRDLLPAWAPYAESQRRLPTPVARTVDWMLVQVLQPSTAAVEGQKSFLLKSDGTVAELDGSSSVLGIPGVSPGLYQVRIRHRNHQAITLRQPIVLSASQAVWLDFASDSSLYAQPAAACPLWQGRWGMWSGDLNQNQAIEIDDFDVWRKAAMSGAQGYSAADLNFDGLVTTRDYIVWRRNQQSGP